MQVQEFIPESEEVAAAENADQKKALTVERVHIRAFGHFRDRELVGFGPGVTVFFGPNEAGKSTLFSFFHTMMFGIYPTSPEQHPYYPWDSRHLQGEMWYRAGNADLVRVERKLMSSASGKLEIGGNQKSLGQRTLPEADFLSKEVFSSVFALDLDDLVAPARSRAWGEIQDRLLGGMNMDFLRSGREVAEDIDHEASRLWRPDGKGKPRAKVVESDLKDLASKIRDAKRRSEDIRDATNEIEEREQQIVALRSEERSISERLARLRRIVPASVSLKRMQEWRELAGDVSRFSALPADPLEELKRLGDEVQTLKAAIEKKRAAVDECLEIENEVTDGDRAVVARATEIRNWDRVRVQVDSWHEQIEKLEAEKVDAVARRNAEAERIFSAGWSDALNRHLRDLQIADLRAAVDAYLKMKQATEEARIRARLQNQGAHRKATTPWMAAAGAIMVVSVVALFVAQYFAAIVGLMLSVLAVAQFFASQKHNVEVEEKNRLDEVESLDRKREQLSREVAALLERLPIPARRVQDLDAQLAPDLALIKRLAEDADQYQEPLKQARQRIDHSVGGLREFAGSLDLTFTSFDHTVEALSNRLSTSSERVQRAEEASRRRRDVENDLNLDAATLMERERSRDQLAAVLEDIGGSVAEGAEMLRQRRRAAERAHDAADHLRQQFGSLADIESEVGETLRTDPDLFTDGEDEQLENERAVLAESLQEEIAAKTKREKDLENWEAQPLLHELESDEMRLRESLGELRRERDRLVLLANIIRAADERYRQRHQPDVIRRASDYFARLTAGRYSGIILEADELYIVPSSGEGSIPMNEDHNWTSRGTRDQIFLSIRLALIDHLDAHHVRLPVFFDEIFVNWDGDRRAEGMRLLTTIASKRQVFLFTCHEWFLEELRQFTDASVITLD